MPAPLRSSARSSRRTAPAVSDTPPHPPGTGWAARLLRAPGRVLALLLALLVAFEEWGWEPLARWLARIGRWPGLRWMERRIRRLPPWGALALFALPSLALLPVKLLALAAMARGHVLLGLAVVVAAKVVGTAVVARLYMLTQPALLQIAAFAWLHAHWMRAKTLLLALLHATRAWRMARVLRRRAVRRVRAWWRAARG